MTKYKLKLGIAFAISIMPTSRIRSLLYRLAFGYKIYDSYVGWGTVIAVDSAVLKECSISRWNKFSGPMNVEICEGSTIGPLNFFQCGRWTQENNSGTGKYERSLYIGAHALINSRHLFDLAGSFHLGSHSWIAGEGSQFWTHGARVVDRNITIGKHCYIGSAVRFAPGSSIGDNCIVALGSVVTHKIKENNAMLAGHPAKVIRENYDWKRKEYMN